MMGRCPLSQKSPPEGHVVLGELEPEAIAHHLDPSLISASLEMLHPVRPGILDVGPGHHLRSHRRLLGDDPSLYLWVFRESEGLVERLARTDLDRPNVEGESGGHVRESAERLCGLAEHHAVLWVFDAILCR